jgi:hypothetical protein
VKGRLRFPYAERVHVPFLILGLCPLRTVIECSFYNTALKPHMFLKLDIKVHFGVGDDLTTGSTVTSAEVTS